MTFGLIEQRAHYKAVKARIASLPPAPTSPVRDHRTRSQIEAQRALTASFIASLNKAAEKTRNRREAIDRTLAALAARERASMPLSPRAIIEAVANKHKLTYADIVGPRRAVAIIAARFEAVWEVDQYFRAREKIKSLPELGRIFGGRDHSTILHCLRKTQARLDREALASQSKQG